MSEVTENIFHPNLPIMGCARSIFALLLLFSNSTSRAETSAENAGIDFFEKEIRPVLVEHCYQCHSASGKTKGGLRLDSRENLARGGDSGAAIIKGDTGASLLIQAIRYHDKKLQMPPKNRLDDREIQALEKWVTMGAPDPRESDPETSPEPSGMSLEEGKKFWSFQPVEVATVPKNGATSPIDAFIQARLQSQNLSPAPPADRRTLIRRVTQNLIGLPPTPEEIDQFLEDKSADAYHKLVERLLASPHYGVRWGRHWLDVARYADSNGLDENLGFGQAWRYRDYVVDSFNRDKPFDQFLIEQIAGDLVTGATQESVTGTGFLQLGPKILAEPDLAKLSMDIIDEQMDTFGKVFLGMTFGCVRCHDHKFDPVSQADYYSLAAIFKSTLTFHPADAGIKKWHEHSLATEAELVKYKEVEKQIAAKNKIATDFKNQEIAKLRNNARAKAVEYLVAAKQIDVMTPLPIIEQAAAPNGLHARMLHHCRTHLAFHRDDPVFEPWHRFNDGDSIRNHYAPIFEKVRQALKKDPKAKIPDDPMAESARLALLDDSGFLSVPSVESLAFDEKTLAQYHRLLEEARSFEINSPDEPSVMSVCDGKVEPELAIHIRGSHLNLGEKVSRNFPAVMRWDQNNPNFPKEKSGRLELATWLANPHHSLTARVIVNRIWAWHFGAGLVTTTENFGVTGARPSHPALLDWLANYFVESGWSIKALHRLILNSKTYQQASLHPNESAQQLIDPENRLLWKANLRRLEVEQIRDGILAVSGRLDKSLGGKTLPLRNRQFVFNHTSEDHTTYHSLRRAIYLPVIRNHLYPMFEQFDYPDPTMPTGQRNETVIAPQALVMMNDDLVMDSSTALAHRIMAVAPGVPGQIDQAYHQILGRAPTEHESQRIQHFFADLTGYNDSSNRVQSEENAWALICQSLLAGNEFIYLR